MKTERDLRARIKRSPGYFQQAQHYGKIRDQENNLGFVRMKAFFRRFLEKADRIPEHALLWVNICLASFVMIAHGSVLTVSYAMKPSEAKDIYGLAMFSLPISAIVIVTATGALIGKRFRTGVLGFHGVILAGSAVVMVVWVSDILLHGIPEGNFGWSPGFFSCWIAYSFFVLCRFSIKKRFRVKAAFHYAPLIAFGIAAVIEIGVAIRFVEKAWTIFGPLIRG